MVIRMILGLDFLERRVPSTNPFPNCFLITTRRDIRAMMKTRMISMKALVVLFISKSCSNIGLIAVFPGRTD